MLFDETANCAPLQTLAGHRRGGLRRSDATVWQSIARTRERYGDAKDTIMGASTDKPFLGPITDKATRDEVVDLLGPGGDRIDDHSTLWAKATAQDLQQLTWGRALVASGALPPAVVRFNPHWRLPSGAVYSRCTDT
jgi:hypothetical protein